MDEIMILMCVPYGDRAYIYIYTSLGADVYINQP